MSVLGRIVELCLMLVVAWLCFAAFILVVDLWLRFA